MRYDNNHDNIVIIGFVIFMLIVFIVGIQVGKWDERQRIKYEQIGEIK